MNLPLRPRITPTITGNYKITPAGIRAIILNGVFEILEPGFECQVYYFIMNRLNIHEQSLSGNKIYRRFM